MWLWRVCVASMEKRITNLFELEIYKDRQVVINHYIEDDFLAKRDGFHFNSLKIMGDTIIFTKNNGNCYELSINQYRELYKDSQFPNYFIFRNNKERLEIYFP